MSNTIYGQVVDLGTAGYVLTSNGAATAPSFQASASGSSGGYTKYVSKTTNYTAVTGDNGTLFDDIGTSGSTQITITLPSAPAKGFLIGVMTTRFGVTNGIKISTSGSDHLLNPNSATTTYVSATPGAHTGPGQSIGFIYMGNNYWGPAYGYVYDFSYA